MKKSYPVALPDRLSDFSIQHTQLTIYRSFYFEMIQSFAHKIKHLSHFLKVGIQGSHCGGKHGRIILCLKTVNLQYFLLMLIIFFILQIFFFCNQTIFKKHF